MEHQKFRNYMAEKGYELRPDEAKNILSITKNFCKSVCMLSEESFLEMFDEDSETIKNLRETGCNEQQISDFRRLLVTARAQKPY